MERLYRYYRLSGQEVSVPEGLRKFAMYFEQQIYNASTSGLPYLTQVYFMIWAVEGMSQSMCPDQSGNHNRPLDSGGSCTLQPEVRNQGKPLPMPVSADPSSQARGQILSQNTTLSNTGSTGVQISASLASAQPLFSGVLYTPILDALAHNLTTQNSMGGAQQVVPELLQKQVRRGLQYVHHQLLILESHEHEILQWTRVKSQMAQLTQQLKTLLWPTSQQPNMQISSAMQPYIDQSANLSGLQQNRPFSTQQSVESKLQHPQSFHSELKQPQQDAHFHRRETPLMQKSLLLTQQRQHFMAQHPNATDMPQQNSVGDINEQHQRSLGQQNNLGNLQHYEDWQELIAQNHMANMENTYLSALSGFSTSQMNMIKSLQLASGLNSGQGSQVGPLSQNTFSAPLQANVTYFSSQSWVNMRQPNIPLQENPHMLQHQHQQLKQKELMKQQQRLNRQAKQHLPAKMQAHQMAQVHLGNDFDEIEVSKEMGVKPDGFQQHISGGHETLYTNQQMKSGASFPISSPSLLQAASPQLSQHSSPDVEDHDNAMITIAFGKSSVIEEPLERLIKAAKSMSSEALCASVNNIGSVVNMIDRIAEPPIDYGSGAALDDVANANHRLQDRIFISPDEMMRTRKLKRATLLNDLSSADSESDKLMFGGDDASDFESTETSRTKRPRIEANHALLEEIREINLRLIDTVVDVSEEDVGPTAASEDGDGTIVEVSFNAVALSPDFKSHYGSMLMPPIQPLRLLMPTNYPSCPPVLLDKSRGETSTECEDLSVKVKSRFGRCLQNLFKPMSLEEIARTWDVCADAVISEYAQLNGGGSFSSKYGTWENFLTAA
ncbi:Mediator of RNA polymerase II transcription subunit 15a [Euphorbia peplus]|nr:Mediator of RNA polymerase II transcription subunit 15a [Euphorbia peplus]